LHTFLFQTEEPDGALYTQYKCYTLWDHCPNTDTFFFFGAGGEGVAAPVVCPAGGLSTPPPCEESVKMPARSHLGEANPVAPDGPASVSRQARGAHP